MSSIASLRLVWQSAGQRLPQPQATLLGLAELLFQLIAEGHQFVDLGDDAVLFGERWEGYSSLVERGEGGQSGSWSEPAPDRTICVGDRRQTCFAS